MSSCIALTPSGFAPQWRGLRLPVRRKGASRAHSNCSWMPPSRSPPGSRSRGAGPESRPRGGALHPRRRGLVVLPRLRRLLLRVLQSLARGALGVARNHAFRHRDSILPTLETSVGGGDAVSPPRLERADRPDPRRDEPVHRGPVKRWLGGTSSGRTSTWWLDSWNVCGVRTLRCSRLDCKSQRM